MNDVFFVYQQPQIEEDKKKEEEKDDQKKDDQKKDDLKKNNKQGQAEAVKKDEDNSKV